MPDLLSSLRQHDLGHLQIVAGFWGLELESRDAESAAQELSAAMLDVELARETLDILPPAARAALDVLLKSGGRLEWSLFARAHGEIREMGEARRDRERPHLKPISAAEILFYRSLLGKAFFDTEKGALQFAYLPEDLLELIQAELRAPSSTAPAQNESNPLGRLATPAEKNIERPASDEILDDLTTLLAALRMNRAEHGLPPEKIPALYALLCAAGLLQGDELQADAVKKFLAASREEALAELRRAWEESSAFDELRLIPTFTCEGEWRSQPQVTRRFLLDLCGEIPSGKWWSLPAFLRDLKTKYPDFQRPAGDYDSWFIKRLSDGQYLRGFAYWEQVDGALARFVIQMLGWLGTADVAAPEAGKEFTAFRLQGAIYTLQGEGKLTVSSSGKITVSRNFSRAVRYQIARFCEWDEEKQGEYSYHIAAKSLKFASQQGLKAEQLLALLAKCTNGSVPPALVKALKNWDAKGIEARVATRPILRVASPEILDALRKSKAAKFLGETLSPTAALLKHGAEAKVLEALTELGAFAEFENEP